MACPRLVTVKNQKEAKCHRQTITYDPTSSLAHYSVMVPSFRAVLTPMNFQFPKSGPVSLDDRHVPAYCCPRQSPCGTMLLALGVSIVVIH